MKNLIKVILVVILIAGYSQVQAQDKKLVSATSFNIVLPQSTFSDTYDHGFGVYANIDYNFNKVLAARFDLGWNDVSGPEKIIADANGDLHYVNPNMSVWEFTAGLRAKFSIFYIEGRAGYFSGINKFGYVPAVGLKFGKLDIQGNYTFIEVGETEWAAIRVAYYW